MQNIMVKKRQQLFLVLMHQTIQRLEMLRQMQEHMRLLEQVRVIMQEQRKSIGLLTKLIHLTLFQQDLKQLMDRHLQMYHFQGQQMVHGLGKLL